MEAFWDERQLVDGTLHPDALSEETYDRPTIVSWGREHMQHPGDLHGQWRFHVPKHGVLATVRLFVIPTRLEEFFIVARVASEAKHPYFSDDSLQGAAGMRFQAALQRMLQMAVTEVDYPRASTALAYAPDNLATHRATPKGIVGYHLIIGIQGSTKVPRDQERVSELVNSFATTAARRAGFTLRYQEHIDAGAREITEAAFVDKLLDDQDGPLVAPTGDQIEAASIKAARRAWRLYRATTTKNEVLLALTDLQTVLYEEPIADAAHQAFCFVHGLLRHQLIAKNTGSSAEEGVYDDDDDDAFYNYGEEDSANWDQSDDDDETRDPYWLESHVTALAREVSGDRTDLFVEPASATEKWEAGRKAPSALYAVLLNDLVKKHPAAAMFFQQLFEAVQPRAARQFHKPDTPVSTVFLEGLEKLIASRETSETWLTPLLYDGAFLRPCAAVYITEIFMDYIRETMDDENQIGVLTHLPVYRHLMMDHTRSARKQRGILSRIFS